MKFLEPQNIVIERKKFTEWAKRITRVKELEYRSREKIQLIKEKNWKKSTEPHKPNIKRSSVCIKKEREN